MVEIWRHYRETESTVVADQDQALSTNYFKKKILKEEIGSKCRLCKEYEEAIVNVTSGCHHQDEGEQGSRDGK